MSTSSKRYAVVALRTSKHTWYWAREVGSITKYLSETWKTPDRAVAERFANENGGEVVELAPRRRR